MVGDRAGILSSIGMEAGFPFANGRAPSKQQSRGRVKPVLSGRLATEGEACANAAIWRSRSRGKRERRMRSYLVVMDETEEALAALRYRGAARGADRRRRSRSSR